MEQEIGYRGVRIVISHEIDGGRRWEVFPESAAAEGAACGIARAGGPRGSFKEAVLAARAAVDEWLGGGIAAAG